MNADGNRPALQSDVSALPLVLRRGMLLLPGVDAYLSVRRRNRPRVGFRVLGLRRVDARTGGPVSLQAALIEHAARQAWGSLSGRFVRPTRARNTIRFQGMKDEAIEISRRYKDDRDAERKALKDLYTSHDVKPFGGWVLTVVVSLIPPLLPALWSSRNQTLYDWLSGTVVVVSGKSDAEDV